MKMTVNDAIKKGADILKEAAIDNSSNEARWIFESVFGNGRELVFFHPDREIDETGYLEKIAERANGRPLQYVIGSWDFYGESFSVGEGVLIPRPETEMLVDFAVEYLKSKPDAAVVDLCAGSGCIGLTAARLAPEANVILIEKSEEAMKYLKRNLEASGLKNVKAVFGDAFKAPAENGTESFDLLLSNPPYIPSSELETLQKEVQKEPSMALDGGNDGLDFYRVIAEKWLPCCSGAVCVECGEGQTGAIENLFKPYCEKTYPQNDLNGIGRTVCGFIK